MINAAINRDMPYFCMNVRGGGMITRVAEYMTTLDCERSVSFRLKWFFDKVASSYSSLSLNGFTPEEIYP